MKTIFKTITLAIALGVMLMADIPLIAIKLVPEAQAIFGVRRRTAVIAYSAGAAAGQSATASSQQQAAAAQQQDAAAKQQTASAQPSSGAPIGHVVEVLPQGCVAVTVGDSEYQKCGDSFYRAAFMGNKLVYVTVEKPF